MMHYLTRMLTPGLLPPYLTRAETAQLCRVSVDTVSAWLRQGKLPKPRRVGKAYLFDSVEVVRALEQREADAENSPREVPRGPADR